MFYKMSSPGYLQSSSCKQGADSEYQAAPGGRNIRNKRKVVTSIHFPNIMGKYILSQFEDCSRTLNKDSLILNVRFPLLMSNIF